MISPSDYIELEFEGGPAFVALDLPENISPRKYFDFAIEDLNSESILSERVKVNAFSNLTRALHFQIEIIADAFGFQNLSNAKYSTFPQKLEFCKKCGVVSPRILIKLNKIRNLVEHAYHIPDESEVTDYFDIVELFLAATDHFIFQFPTEIEISISEKLNKGLPDIFSVMLPPNEGIIYLLSRSANIKKDKRHSDFNDYLENCSIKISVKEEPYYYKWVKLIIDNIL